MKKRPKILPVKIMHGSKNKKAAAAAARDGLVMASFELGARKERINILSDLSAQQVPLVTAPSPRKES
ncbi:hypothetical protein CUMW_017430 [Citrus unshiu]|nr:hypothetical protein CUMW_017430 [Citrus unshiu]